MQDAAPANPTSHPDCVQEAVSAPDPGAALPYFAAGLFLAVTTAVVLSLMTLTGARFMYSLDDPYIHLALAERLAGGHYGINLGEVTSPSSSVIWPFLLVPGVGLSLHKHLPLAINLVAGAGVAVLLGRFVAGLSFGRENTVTTLQRLGLVAVLVLASNAVGLALTGMEHNLQVLLAVASALGLIEVARGRNLPWWAFAAAALGPAVRYELLAVTAAVIVMLAAERQWRPALTLLLASVALPALLSLYLVAHGNAPLPNSVLTKLGVARATSPDASFGAFLLPRHWRQDMPQRLVLGTILVSLIWMSARRRGAVRVLCAAAALAAGLHFLLGRFGWFFRYDVYAVMFCGIIALWAAARIWPRHGILVGALIASVYASAVIPAALLSPRAAQNIYEQHYQMHRFVAEYWRKPFAVNDLGWVSYRLDPSVYVLDLWGLASNEAVRQRSKTPEWLDDVTRRHGAGLAMIYEHAFRAVPQSWTKVADLELSGPRITAAGRKVAFFATGVGDADDLRNKLIRFSHTLPRGVSLHIVTADKPGGRAAAESSDP
jgi:hypothetical protein